MSKDEFRAAAYRAAASALHSSGHLAVLAVDAAAPWLVREAKVEALREAASDPAARLGGHSGVSVRWLLRRADEIEAGIEVQP